MRVPRIFTSQPLAPHCQVQLEPAPSQHLVRVLRLSPGDAITLFDGDGGEYPARILAVGKKVVRAETAVLLERDIESPLSLHLGIAVSRGDRMDWIVQKATELGVAEISPLFSERTEVRLAGERLAKKLRHWRLVAISACEQCGRNRLPAINPPRTLRDWLTGVDAERRFVLHHRADRMEGGGHTPQTVALLVGPEGGLSGEEIDAAHAQDFESLQLGPRVLRTETAPLAAISILQARWGDMNPLP